MRLSSPDPKQLGHDDPLAGHELLRDPALSLAPAEGSCRHNEFGRHRTSTASGSRPVNGRAEGEVATDRFSAATALGPPTPPTGVLQRWRLRRRLGEALVISHTLDDALLRPFRLPRFTSNLARTQVTKAKPSWLNYMRSIPLGSDPISASRCVMAPRVRRAASGRPSRSCSEISR